MHHAARTSQQIGAIVRNARKERGLSQAALAAKAGLRQETLSLLENGNPATRADTLLSLLGALDLEMAITKRQRTSAEDIEALF